ncbi:MAG TPA: hypothetical protein VFI86_02995 [Burkholderiales bacterium]|nr:hypothetical protein [Burkholderiales bacterium]
MKRDLFATVKMLRAGGLNAGVRVGDGMIVVFLEDRVATFRTLDFGVAANWLAECACRNHPGSDLARLWRVLARAATVRIPHENSGGR